MEMIKCPNCDGNGICSNCSGEGEIEEYCEGYSKGRKTDCDECNGSGNCEDCQGEGEIESD